MDQISRIRDKLFSKKGKELTADDIDLIHDTLMSEYGWIPLEEFKNLPLPTLWYLWGRIMERRKKESEQMEGKTPKRRLR